jgi:hypothetical protein
MDQFHTHEDFIKFYNELVKIYKIDKKHILSKIREKFRYQYDTLPKDITDGYHNQLYKLKVALEIQFMRDVKCKYKFIFFTPINFGCDLRELIFNNEREILRVSLLDNINRASRYFVTLITKQKIPHILTDLDDTLYPNHSFFTEISGRDHSWKNKEPYPGICTFYKIFYSNLPIEASRYTTLLTATPLFLKESKLEDERLIEILGQKFGFIQGSEKKREIIDIMFDSSNNRSFYNLAPSAMKIGMEKFKKFCQYSQIFPEYQLLFIGDNGQGDLIAGKMMIENNSEVLVFIHNIICDGDYLFTKTQECEHQMTTDGRLYFFKNYLELAYIFTNNLRIFTKQQYNEFKEAVKIDIINGLEKDMNPDKHLYEHYTYIHSRTHMSPKSSISISDLLR